MSRAAAGGESDVNALLGRADAVLYAAKAAERDRMFSQPDTREPQGPPAAVAQNPSGTVERRDAKRPDRRQTLARGRRALALFQLSALVSVLLGYRYFDERRIGRRLIGAVVMVAGAALIVMAGHRG